MNALIRFDPLRELADVQNRLVHFFDRTPTRLDSGQESLTTTEWLPLVDISENDHEFTIKAEIPEVKKEDVYVGFENGVLTISGQRKQEKEEKTRKYHRIERSYGNFVRSFTIPANTDVDKISSESKDGVLRVHLPKSPKARPKQIEIKAS